MLTEIKIAKTDHGVYGDHFHMVLNFEGRLYTYTIQEAGFESVKEEMGEPVASGQFGQDISYTLKINNGK